MGKENIESVGNEKTRAGGGSTESTATTSTKNSGGGRGTGRGRGGAAGQSSEKSVEIPNVKAPKIVQVDAPKKPETVESDKPKRGRPAGSTAKRTPPKKQAAKMDHTQLSLLLVTMTGVLASRENMSPFALTMEEANQISLPLSNILAKNEGIASATAEYADHIALLFAAATIMIPKFLLYQSTRKVEIREVLPNDQTSAISRSSHTDDREPTHTRNVQNDGSTFNGSIIEHLNPIAGI